MRSRRATSRSALAFSAAADAVAALAAAVSALASAAFALAFHAAASRRAASVSVRAAAASARACWASNRTASGSDSSAALRRRYARLRSASLSQVLGRPGRRSDGGTYSILLSDATKLSISNAGSAATCKSVPWSGGRLIGPRCARGLARRSDGAPMVPARLFPCSFRSGVRSTLLTAATFDAAGSSPPSRQRSPPRDPVARAKPEEVGPRP